MRFNIGLRFVSCVRIHAGIDTGDDSASRRDCASPESLHLQSEIQKLQVSVSLIL